MELILCEKPKIGRDTARLLGIKEQHQEYIVCKDGFALQKKYFFSKRQQISFSLPNEWPTFLAGRPAGAPDNVVRTVTENSRTLKFTGNSGFEVE